MAAVSLPSIHEMFPDHLLQLQPAHSRRVSSSKTARSRPAASPEHHYEVLRSRPESSSLQSVSSSRASPSDDDEAHEERRHLCRLCHKRFNRPSSLRIHMNTHTGATPFPCPFPGCGRSFNVNSNMRRHYRNHNAGAPPPASPPAALYTHAHPYHYSQQQHQQPEHYVPHLVSVQRAPNPGYVYREIPPRPDSCSSHSSASSSSGDKRQRGVNASQYVWAPPPDGSDLDGDDDGREFDAEMRRPRAMRSALRSSYAR